MAITAQRGPGIGLPTFGNTNTLQLAAGNTQVLAAGQYYVTTGPYSFLQYLDPITQVWRTVTEDTGQSVFVTSDGANLRIANLTGCAVGAILTNVGSAYTSAPTVTASAGNSTWRAIVGGAINSTVTITTAGTLYNFPPQLIVSLPPPGGVPATAVCTVSAGAINAVTVTNQGAGYTTAPTITVVRDPRDTTAGAVTAVLTVNATLAGAGTVTAILNVTQGSAVTAVPTLTITGGGGASAAATAVMCFTTTGLTVGAGGVAYGNAQPFLVITGGGVVTATPGAVVNPQISTAMFTPRQANYTGTSTAGGAITATGLVTNDSGLFQSVPAGFVIAGGTGLATTVGQVTMTVGGVSDVSLVQPF